MPTSDQPVIVYHGRNEFDAQMARDVLQSASIPVVHVPSLSTGIFGVAHSTRVAVPADFADAAVEALLEEGFEAHLQSAPTGLAAFRDTIRETLPLERSAHLPKDSQLRRVLVGIALVILALAIWASLRGL